jgi:hypothetical protein
MTDPPDQETSAGTDAPGAKAPRMGLWRRRRPAPPQVVLPSLDRLAGLIERVVELVDEVSGGRVGAPDAPEQPAAPPDPPAAAAPPRAPAAPPRAAPDDVWLAYVPSPHGYGLVERQGSAPPPGDALELDGVRHRVVRFIPSPLPGDTRRCAVVEREEPPEPERTLDA